MQGSAAVAEDAVHVVLVDQWGFAVPLIAWLGIFGTFTAILSTVAGHIVTVFKIGSRAFHHQPGEDLRGHTYPFFCLAGQGALNETQQFSHHQFDPLFYLLSIVGQGKFQLRPNMV